MSSHHPYICMTTQWSGHVRSCDKLNTLYLDLQETNGRQTRLGAVLLWEVPTLKAKWLFDYVTNVTSRDKLKSFHFVKTNGRQTWMLTYRGDWASKRLSYHRLLVVVYLENDLSFWLQMWQHHFSQAKEGTSKKSAP